MTVSIQSTARPHVGPIEPNRRKNTSWRLPVKQSMKLKHCALSLNRRMRAKAPRTVCDSAKSGLWLPPIRMLDMGDHHEPDRWREPSREATSALPHVGRRQALSLVQRKVRFQQMRHHLWCQGPKALGNLDHPDMAAFVIARRLQQPSCVPSSAKERDTCPDQGQRPVRVVIRPRDGVPITLSREFDLNRLRATIPDPLPSPPSPPMDSLLGGPPLDELIGCFSGSIAAATHVPSTSDQGKRSKATDGTRAVPIHRGYARATLPILASIMMSSKVSHGDRIELPMPHPKAWPETAAYIYTGKGELLGEQVRQNILYLGGRV